MNEFGASVIEPAEPPTDNEKMLALVSHLLPLVVCFIGPLIIWLIKKEESPFVAYAAKQATIWSIAIFVAAIILAVVTSFIGGIGSVLASIVGLVYMVLAAVRTYEGKQFTYPVVGTMF